MTTEFATLLRILSSASAGEPFPALPEGLDWPLLEKLAREQSAPGLWGYALYHAKAVIPEPVLVRGKQQYFFLVAREAYRRAGILRLLADLDGMGIRAAVLKGFAVGESYAVPECRISGDVDLLVDPKDEARTIALLTGQGFTVQRRCVDAHHDIAVHPSLGLVELHVRLYEEMFGQHWFEGAFLAPARPHVRMETPKGVFWTLAPDDHMLFLLLHLAKHFVIGGINLRMLLDCGLFYRAHAAELDRVALTETLKKLRLDRLVGACFYALIHTGGVAIPDAPFQDIEGLPALAEKLLTDLEAHIFLREDQSHSRRETRDAFAKRRLGKRFASSEAQRRFVRLPRKIFPYKSQLRKEYPVLIRRPILLPAVWLVRSVKKIFRHGSATPKALTANEKRLALFEELGLFDK